MKAIIRNDGWYLWGWSNGYMIFTPDRYGAKWYDDRDSWIFDNMAEATRRGFVVEEICWENAKKSVESITG